MEPLGIAPKKAWDILDCGPTKGYELINAGELVTFKVGRATRVTVESIKAYVARQVAHQQAA